MIRDVEVDTVRIKVSKNLCAMHDYIVLIHWLISNKPNKIILEIYDGVKEPILPFSKIADIYRELFKLANYTNYEIYRASAVNQTEWPANIMAIEIRVFDEYKPSIRNDVRTVIEQSYREPALVNIGKSLYEFICNIIDNMTFVERTRYARYRSNSIKNAI